MCEDIMIIVIFGLVDVGEVMGGGEGGKGVNGIVDVLDVFVVFVDCFLEKLCVEG